MELREPLRLPPTRDVVRVLGIIFGFYVLVRLLWIAHPVVFLFFLGVLFGLHWRKALTGWRSDAFRAGSGSQ